MQIAILRLRVFQILSLMLFSLKSTERQITMQGKEDEEEIPKDEPQAPPENGGEIEKPMDDIPEEDD